MKFKVHFEKGGRFERLYPVYEMLTGMLLVPPHPTARGAHIRDHYDVKRMMVSVIIAGIPALIFGTFNAGYQHYLSAGTVPSYINCLLKGASIVVPLYIVVYTVGGLWELLFAVVRRHEVAEGFLVTGFLIPLIVPPTIPLWQLAAGTTFGVVIGKEVFGGTGMNVFNPAMVARAFIFFAYPSSISGNDVWTVTGSMVVDTFTAATPLSIAASGGTSDIASQLSAGGYSFHKMFIGLEPGCIGETSTMMILAGALFLTINGVASWRIIGSVFAGGYITALAFNFAAPSPSHIFALPAHYHLVMGGFAFGAVFMATDPVSASATNTGKYIYGFMTGSLAVVVRLVNPAYPEGMMLSVLFMNAFAPLIDSAVIWASIRRRSKRAAG